MNYYPNYSTHRLYFGEVETPYCCPSCVCTHARLIVVYFVVIVSLSVVIVVYFVVIVGLSVVIIVYFVVIVSLSVVIIVYFVVIVGLFVVIVFNFVVTVVMFVFALTRDCCARPFGGVQQTKGHQ